MKKITIHPVSRIEGHAKITIRLDDDGQVAGTQFHVTQIRGFEKFIKKVNDEGKGIVQINYIGGPTVAGNSGGLTVQGAAGTAAANSQLFPFHNHDDYKATNNGVYPGGMFTVIQPTP
mgnify:CR=1 FL=1